MDRLGGGNLLTCILQYRKKKKKKKEEHENTVHFFLQLLQWKTLENEAVDDSVKRGREFISRYADNLFFKKKNSSVRTKGERFTARGVYRVNSNLSG